MILSLKRTRRRGPQIDGTWTVLSPKSDKINLKLVTMRKIEFLKGGGGKIQNGMESLNMEAHNKPRCFHSGSFKE
jgi:hypothetical protein